MKEIRLSIFLLFFSHTLFSQVSISFETGLAFSGYNDVQIPAKTATRFSFSNDLEMKPQAFYRIRTTYQTNKHNFSILFAPLTLTSKGSIKTPIYFQNEIFEANSDLKGVFKFNSYRFTYSYILLEKEKIRVDVGITAKIRDAKISLENKVSYAEKTDFGFVPLIYFAIDWKINKNLSVQLNGDALASKYGRAEDIFCGINYLIFEKMKLKAGYRMLEGGSDGTSVYTFSLTHFAVMGVAFFL